jgi:hypothetical protein
VIGNPPYLRVQGLRENFEIESKFYETIYHAATGRFDIYALFIEKAFQLINPVGCVSFILPHKFMVSDFGEGIRGFLVKNKVLNSIVHFGSEMVFADASTYTCIIGLSFNNTFIKYKQLNPKEILYDFQFERVDYNILDNNKWNLHGGGISKLFEKLNHQPYTLKDIFKNISQGIVSVGDDIFLMKGKIYGDKFIGYSEKVGREVEIEAELMKPILKGEDVKKYAILEPSYFVIYPHYEIEGKTLPFDEEEFKGRFPLAYNYFLPFKKELIDKKVRYKTNPTCWYSLHRSREVSLFEQKEKIITPEISLGTNMTFDAHQLYHNTKCYSLIKNEEIDVDYKYLLAILNSSLMWIFLNSTGYVLRGGFFTFKTKYLEPFPFPQIISIDQQKPFIKKVDFMLSKNKDLQEVTNKFQRTIQRKFNLEDLPGKLQNWYLLSYAEFITELAKKKVKLTLTEEAEWEAYFLQEAKQALALKSEIDKTDKEIDRMVFELYGLTEEEIRIVEGTN